MWLGNWCDSWISLFYSLGVLQMFNFILKIVYFLNLGGEAVGFVLLCRV